MKKIKGRKMKKVPPPGVIGDVCFYVFLEMLLMPTFNLSEKMAEAVITEGKFLHFFAI